MNRWQRDDWRRAKAAAVDDLYRRAGAAPSNPPTVAAPPAVEGWTDPDCRAAKADPGHVCARRDGRLLGYGETCHTEARAQLADAAAAAKAKAVGTGPKYRPVDPAVRRAQDAHDGCPSSAMEYGPNGARCTSCGVTWPLARKADGTPVGYTSPPTVAMSRRIANGFVD